MIGFAFDGTGYGDDRAVWGGEFMIADYRSYRRVGHLRYALLPGGDAGVRNPCRMALSHLSAAGLDWDSRLPSVAACTDAGAHRAGPPAEDRAELAADLEHGPAVRRDVLADRHLPPDRVRGRGGHALRRSGPAGDRGLRRRRTASPLDTTGSAIIADPMPVLRAAADDVLGGTPTAIIAARFHHAVADLVADVALVLRDQTMINTVALSGGVFLNVLLTRLCVDRLLDRDFRVLRHSEVPPSDAGIALGQLVIGAQISGGRSYAMCLAVPGAVLDIWEKDGTKMAKVDFGGVEKEVCCEFVPDIAVGDYTIVHVGFALQRLDEKSAKETLANFERMGELEMEFGDAWARAAKEAGAPRPDVSEVQQVKYIDEFNDPDLAAAAARRHPRHGDPALGPDGGLRRPDALDHPARHRPVDPRTDRDDPRAGLPGLRDPAGADRQGAGDRLPPGRDLLLVRRHAPGAGQRPRPVPDQEPGRRRAGRLLPAGRAEDRSGEPGPARSSSSASASRPRRRRTP